VERAVGALRQTDYAQTAPHRLFTKQPEKDITMTTTLSRRIRRIGLLPTTYKEIKETVLRRNDEGQEVEVVHTKKVPVRHHSRISNDDRQVAAERIRVEALQKRKK
jgi:hypothetical protein